jgi:hypothetical protein
VQITKRLIAIGVASAATVATGLGVATTVDSASATAKVHHLKFVAVRQRSTASAIVRSSELM